MLCKCKWNKLRVNSSFLQGNLYKLREKYIGLSNNLKLFFYMGRPTKQGLEYFSLDVRMFSDIKIRKLIKYHKAEAVSVYMTLLCRIYEKGYFIEYDKDLPFIISEDCGLEEDTIVSIIRYCLDVELFDKGVFDKHKVLTSHGIQERYMQACAKTKRKLSKGLPYLLVDLGHDLVLSNKKDISSEETLVFSEETVINSEESTDNSEKSTQNKNKEKEKEKNKGDSNESLSSPPATTDSEINLLAFQEFFNRTMQEHGAQIPTITQISGKRKQSLLARFKEHGKEKLRTAVINAAKSPFLNGASEKPFVASFDWIFRPNNFPKVLEGNYNHDVLTTTNSNGHGQTQQLTAQQRIDADLQRGAEHFAGLLAKNEASLRDGVPAKVW